MDAVAEIENRFAEGHSCNALLYTPVEDDVTCRTHRVYHASIGGDGAAWRAFVDGVLADPVRDLVHDDGQPAVEGWNYFVEYGLKANCLDLEKEYLLRYYRELQNPGFSLDDLRITHRVYVFGSLAPERLVRDLINPVVHEWEVTHAA